MITRRVSVEMMKRMRTDWYAAQSPAPGEYLLTIQSRNHVDENDDSSSPVKFVVAVKDIPSTSLDYLELSPNCEVGVESFVAPNNCETFQVIDNETNWSMVFFQ